MSTHLKDKQEKILQAIEKLREDAAKGKLIIVEGKKDAQALLELGVEGKVLMLKTGGKSTLEALTEIEALGLKEVVLLLDFDRRGKEATKRLTQELERLKIKANKKYWRALFGLVGSEVQCIEGLPRYLETFKAKVSA